MKIENIVIYTHKFTNVWDSHHLNSLQLRFCLNLKYIENKCKNRYLVNSVTYVIRLLNPCIQNTIEPITDQLSIKKE